MPVFDITSPDGTKYRVTAPEGATQDQALERVRAQHQPAAAPQQASTPAANIIPDTKQAYQAGREQAASGVSDLMNPQADLSGKIMGGIKTALGEFSQVQAPVTGTIKAMVHDPVEQSGLPGAKYLAGAAEGVADIAVPGALGKVAGATLRATPKMAAALARKTGEAVDAVRPAPAASLDSVAHAADATTAKANQLYLDATAKGGTLKSAFTNNFIDRSVKRLPDKAGGLPKSRGPEAEKLRSDLTGLKDSPLTLKGMQMVDEDLGGLIDKEYDARGHLSKHGNTLLAIQQDLRQSIASAGPRDIDGGTEGFKALQEGRKAWSQAMKIRDVQRVVERAQNSENQSVTLRQGLRTILNNPKRLRAYQPDEVAEMKRALKKGSAQELMSKIGMKGAASAGAAAGSVLGGFPVGTAVGAGVGAAASRLGNSAMTAAQMRSLQRVMDALGANVPRTTP